MLGPVILVRTDTRTAFPENWDLAITLHLQTGNSQPNIHIQTYIQKDPQALSPLYIKQPSQLTVWRANRSKAHQQRSRTSQVNNNKPNRVAQIKQINKKTLTDLPDAHKETKGESGGKAVPASPRTSPRPARYPPALVPDSDVSPQKPQIAKYHQNRKKKINTSLFLPKAMKYTGFVHTP